MREMILKKQKMEREECISVLSSSEQGVLAYYDEDNCLREEPCYYVYKEGSLQLFTAERIKEKGKASFAAVKEDNVVPEDFTTLYRSVICFGEIVTVGGKPVFNIHHFSGKKAEELL